MSVVGLRAREKNLRIYRHSQLQAMLEIQYKETGRLAGLFTDIDHTYWKAGKENAISTLNLWLEAEHIPSIAVTGNDFASVTRRIRTGELPHFQAIASSVGTELWILGVDGQYVRDDEFTTEFKEMDFDRENIVSRSRTLINEMHTTHPEWRFNFQHPEKERELLIHPYEEYQRYKVSFYFYALAEDIEKVEYKVKNYFPHTRVIVCEEIGYNSTLPPSNPMKKYCLDILPVTKADVVRYISYRFGLTEGVVAGDSGNDVDMLLNTPPGFTAVLVGGARSEAIKAIEAVSNPVPGQENVRQLANQQGKYIFVDYSQRIGPESILHAFMSLRRVAKKTA